jgi:hypothetical protein
MNTISVNITSLTGYYNHLIYVDSFHSTYPAIRLPKVHIYEIY